MKVWTIVGFEGHWPVGTSAVAIAPDLQTAKDLLNEELKAMMLPTLVEEGGWAPRIVELDLENPKAIILQDGEY